MKNFLKTSVFLVGAIALILCAQNVLQLKFLSDSTKNVNGFYCEEENSIDVVILGSSSAFCTINPLVLYEEYGFTAYDFCASSQPLDISYYYLKEALKYQTPKVVVLEVGLANCDNQDVGFRWSYGDTRMSMDKLKAIYNSVGAINYDFFSYLFPILEYKERWKTLAPYDWTYYASDKWDYSKGYLVTDEVSVTPIDFSGYDKSGKYNLSDKNLKSLNDIVQLCEAENIELVLFKAPAVAWDSSLTRAIQEYADANDLLYIDYLLKMEEIGLDVANDFRNENHLNNSGAEKVTLDLGKILNDRYDIPDRKNDSISDSWKQGMEYYKEKT